MSEDTFELDGKDLKIVTGFEAIQKRPSFYCMGNKISGLILQVVDGVFNNKYSFVAEKVSLYFSFDLSEVRIKVRGGEFSSEIFSNWKNFMTQMHCGKPSEEAYKKYNIFAEDFGPVLNALCSEVIFTSFNSHGHYFSWFINGKAKILLDKRDDTNIRGFILKFRLREKTIESFGEGFDIDWLKGELIKLGYIDKVEFINEQQIK